MITTSLVITEFPSVTDIVSMCSPVSTGSKNISPVWFTEAQDLLVDIERASVSGSKISGLMIPDSPSSMYSAPGT